MTPNRRIDHLKGRRQDLVKGGAHTWPVKGGDTRSKGKGPIQSPKGDVGTAKGAQIPEANKS